ncbi:MAG: metalloregulator ArsR/SmtB family transcription factor [Endomicrobiia bacterium]
MKILEKTLKALADKNRIRILKLLETKKMCVCELSHVLGIAQPSVSRHLKKLKSAEFIKDEQDGFWTNYVLNKPANIYGSKLNKFIKESLNDDLVIKQDSIKSSKAKRANICKTKNGRKC